MTLFYQYILNSIKLKPENTDLSSIKCVFENNALNCTANVMSRMNKIVPVEVSQQKVQQVREPTSQQATQKTQNQQEETCQQPEKQQQHQPQQPEKQQQQQHQPQQPQQLQPQQQPQQQPTQLKQKQSTCPTCQTSENLPRG